jgi:hypothetical protein
MGQAAIGILERMRRPMRRALRGSRFGEPHDIRDMLSSVGDAVIRANQAG